LAKAPKPKKDPKKSVPPALGGENKRDTTALTDTEKAHIWALKEGGHSYREIAKETKRSLATIWRVLAEDISRLETLVRAAKEERARLFENIENRGLKSLQAWIDEAHRTMFTPKGRVRGEWGEKQERVMKYGPRMIGALRLAADTCTKQAQLLTGGPTERFAGVPASGREGSMAEELVGEPELVAEAIRLGMKKDLPPAVLEKYTDLIAQVEGESKTRTQGPKT
jgi:hypothetical protein